MDIRYIYRAPFFCRLCTQALSYRKAWAGRSHFIRGGFNHEILPLDFVNADPAILAGALYQLGDLFHHVVALPASDDRRADFLKCPALAIAAKRLLPAASRLPFFLAGLANATRI